MSRFPRPFWGEGPGVMGNSHLAFHCDCPSSQREEGSSRDVKGNGKQEFGINCPSPPARNPLPKRGEGRMVTAAPGFQKLDSAPTVLKSKKLASGHARRVRINANQTLGPRLAPTAITPRFEIKHSQGTCIDRTLELRPNQTQAGRRRTHRDGPHQHAEHSLGDGL